MVWKTKLPLDFNKSCAPEFVNRGLTVSGGAALPRISNLLIAAAATTAAAAASFISFMASWH